MADFGTPEPYVHVEVNGLTQPTAASGRLDLTLPIPAVGTESGGAVLRLPGVARGPGCRGSGEFGRIGGRSARIGPNNTLCKAPGGADPAFSDLQYPRIQGDFAVSGGHTGSPHSSTKDQRCTPNQPLRNA